MLYIHIGTHKTGTTSIQKFFNNNFSDKNNIIFYPNIGKYEYGHHDIAWSFGKDHSKLNFILSSLKDAMSEHKNILISSEEFSFLKYSDISLFASFFKNIDIRIICYLRKRSDFLISEYKQNIMMGKSRYNRSLFQFLFETRTIERLSYFEILNKWASVFGPESIFPAIFSKSSLKNSDVIHDFIDLIGLDIKNPTDLMCENVGLSDHAALLLCELNRVSMPAPRHGFVVEALRGVTGENKILTQGERDHLDRFYIDDDLKLLKKFNWREKDSLHIERNWRDHGENNI